MGLSNRAREWRPLTQRQQQLISFLRLNPWATNKEIASAFCVSLSTAKSHISGVFWTLGIPNRHVLVDWIRHGLE